MTILLIILIIIAVTAVTLGWIENSQKGRHEARRLADYDVRELAGELTAEELAELRTEERENYERRTSAREVLW